MDKTTFEFLHKNILIKFCFFENKTVLITNVYNVQIYVLFTIKKHLLS